MTGVREVLSDQSFTDLPSNQIIVGGVITVQFLFLITVLLETYIPWLAGLRLIVAVVYLSFVPGILVLAIFGADLDRKECLAYSVLVSLFVLMGWGVILNTAYVLFNETLAPPLTEFRLFGSVSVLVLSLLGVFWYTGAQPALPRWNPDRMSSVHVFSLLVLGNAVLGATIINWYGTNVVALLTICFIVVGLLLLLYTGEKRQYPIVVWVLSLSTLYSSALVHDNLQPGDGMWEFYHSNLVLTYGFWNVDFPSTFNSVLGLVVLHPLYTVLTGLDLYWEYKIVYPFLFSFLGPVLYLQYDRTFDSETSLVSVAFFIFSFPFFAWYSRDTRSGLTLLFIAIFVLVLSDEHLKKRPRRLLIVVSLFVLVTSHYGLSVLFVGLLGVTTVVYYLLGRLEAQRSGLESGTLVVATGISVLTYVVWYRYIASGVVLATVETTLAAIVEQFNELFAEESNVGRSVLFAANSFSYQFIRFQNILLILFAVLGWTIGVIFSTPLRSLIEDRFGLPTATPSRISSFYLSFGVGAGALIAGNFAPTQILGIERTFTLVSMFLIPFAVYAVKALIEQLGDYTRPILAGALVITFLVNSGFVAALLNERSPNANIDQSETIETGSEFANFHLYYSYRQNEEVSSSNWLQTHQGECDVYGPDSIAEEPVTYLTYTEFDPVRPPGIDYREDELRPKSGYLYLGAYSQQFKNVRLGIEVRGSAQPRVLEFDALNLHTYNRIYDNNESVVLLRGRCD